MHTTTRKLLALMLSTGLLSVAFQFDAGGIHWIWAGQPGVAVALGCMTAGFGIAALIALHNARHQPPR